MASARSRAALASVCGPLSVYRRRGVPGAPPAWNSGCGMSAPGDTIGMVTSIALPPALESRTLLAAAVIVHDRTAEKRSSGT